MLAPKALFGDSKFNFPAPLFIHHVSSFFTPYFCSLL